MVFAREGFNIIATANTRDRGVNEMSAALKRRFNFETVFPIADFDTELALVEAEAAARCCALRASRPRRAATCSRCWSRRSASCAPGDAEHAMDRLSAVMSTAEAVSVAHAVGLRGWFLRGEQAPRPATSSTAWPAPPPRTTPRTSPGCAATWSSRSPSAKAPHWQALHEARHLLPG